MPIVALNLGEACHFVRISWVNVHSNGPTRSGGLRLAVEKMVKIHPEAVMKIKYSLSACELSWLISAADVRE
ncbi:MAG: hypothetical protein JO356_08480 [Acidobacteria bacterium]|nr:hypothetical protein [Acidobacteriota bacterium]